MPVQPDQAQLSVGEFRSRIGNDLVPLSSQFFYFSIAVPLAEEDLRDYLEDPVASLPVSLSAALPHVAFLLVPYIERVNGKGGAKPNGKPNGSPRSGRKAQRHAEPQPKPQDLISFERPAEGNALRSSLSVDPDGATIALAVQDQEVADYHYELYRQIAILSADLLPEDQLQDYRALLREELVLHVHGEVDEQSWQLKQALQRRQTNMKRDTKVFREYAHASFVDTLTLYLHGICCDIDVETGPRQLPSRYLRRRLQLLNTQFPPPTGFAVFPEDLDREESHSLPSAEAEPAADDLEKPEPSR